MHLSLASSTASLFDVKVGGRNDVNYITFCEMIDDYAQTKWSDPALK